MVNFEQLEWHRSGENEACHMSKGQKSHLLADLTEKTARTAESSLGLAKDLGGPRQCQSFLAFPTTKLSDRAVSIPLHT